MLGTLEEGGGARRETAATLLFATSDKAHNQAVVLLGALKGRKPYAHR